MKRTRNFIKTLAFVLYLLLETISSLSLHAQEFKIGFPSPNGGAGFRSGIYRVPFYYFVGHYVDTARRVHTIAYKVHPNGRRLDSLDIAFPNANTFNGWYSSSFWSLAEDRLIIVGSTWDSIKKNTLMVIKADKDLIPTDTMDLPGLATAQTLFKGIEDTDSSYLFVGQSTKTDTSNREMLFMRVKHDGTILTEQFYGSPKTDVALAVDTIPGGGYYLTGATYGMGNGNGQYANIVIYRLDSAYQIVWRKIIGNYYNDFVYDISTTPDSGCVIGGMLNTEFSGNNQRGLPYLAKYDLNGQLEWDTLVAGLAAHGAIHGIEVLECGDILGCGLHFDLSISNLGFGYLFRSSSTGYFKATIIDTGIINEGFVWRDIRQASNAGVVLAGIAYPSSGPNVNEDIFCIGKIDSIASQSLCQADDSLNTFIQEGITNTSGINIYPNPSSGLVHFKSNAVSNTDFEIYSLEGRLVMNSSFHTETTIESSRIGKGVFIVRFITEDRESQTKRMIIQ